MQACLTVHPPEGAAIVRVLAPGDALRIGRGGDCGLRIVHPSVSRLHAELHYRRGGWQLRDLGSKNGSYVEGQRLHAEEELELQHVAWLRFGDVYCEFALLDDADAARAEAARRARRAAATAHTARLDGVHKLDELLDASLRGVLELAQCERGFVLLRQGMDDAPDAGFTVAASQSLDPASLSGQEFSGSVGAVQRALHDRRSVIVNDVVSEAWLSSRASVAAAGLSALVCLPLHDGRQALGAIYADRTRPGPPLTTLDQELLEAFAERAALWIAARRTSDLLAARTAGMPAKGMPDWSRIVAAHPPEAP
jgi:predicted component of type VI protein secretion system